MPNTPLTASDLRDIAQALEPIELLPAITENPIIGDIEVLRPGGDEIIGHFVREGRPDGSGEAWLGFRPWGFES